MAHKFIVQVFYLWDLMRMYYVDSLIFFISFCFVFSVVVGCILCIFLFVLILQINDIRIYILAFLSLILRSLLLDCYGVSLFLLATLCMMLFNFLRSNRNEHLTTDHNEKSALVLTDKNRIVSAKSGKCGNVYGKKSFESTSNSTIHWRIKIHDKGYFVLIGIMNEAHIKNINSLEQPFATTGFGYGLFSRGQLFAVYGKSKSNYCIGGSDSYKFKSGDIITMSLNSRRKELTFVINNDQNTMAKIKNIKTSQSVKYRFAVHLYESGEKIELLEHSVEEEKNEKEVIGTDDNHQVIYIYPFIKSERYTTEG